MFAQKLKEYLTYLIKFSKQVNSTQYYQLCYLKNKIKTILFIKMEYHLQFTFNLHNYTYIIIQNQLV